jgi:hypothetical protein
VSVLVAVYALAACAGLLSVLVGRRIDPRSPSGQRPG